VGRIAGALALGVLGLVLGLALLEAGLAVLSGPPTCRGGRVPFWRPVASAGWALRAGATGEALVCRAETELARHAVAINALGQRDRPRTLARGTTPRVLVLGDSFVEGLQVDLDDTFPARLERNLGVEVLNAGVSGYATDNELRAFARRLYRYRPDAVLLVFYVGNDVLENGARLFLGNPHGLPPKPWLRARDASPALARCLAVHRGAAHVADVLPDVVWSRSRVLRFATSDAVQRALGAACAGAAGPALVDGAPELLGVYGAPATIGWREAWDETERLLLHLAGRVRRSGMRFGVALAPAALEYDPAERWLEAAYPALRGRTWDWDYPYGRLQPLLRAHDVPVVSLAPALRDAFARTGRCGCWDWDGHWDAEGHATVAAALEPLVRTLVR